MPSYGVHYFKKLKMDKITDVSVTHCTDSRYVQPFRVLYKQDGKQKFWDCTKVHDR